MQFLIYKEIALKMTKLLNTLLNYSYSVQYIAL
jgi:hypothetical protein